ncbi:MAG: lytic murein transglycosylase [Deltaproteobacteria bacterium]|nr:MAG: lytic murein transglycosylase [Deltaproteobacteria bacterium]
MTLLAFMAMKEVVVTWLSNLRHGKTYLLFKLAAVVLVTFNPLCLLADESPFANLERRLIEDGLDARLVQSIYQHPMVKLELAVAAGNLIRSEATLDYGQFLSAYSVAKAERYLRRHSHVLEEVEKRFGVPREIVVAVLMVETALGTYPGKYLTINVLSTMAVARERGIQDEILSSLKAEQRRMQSPEVISRRLKKRAVRSYRELKALVNYIHKNDVDPFSLVGSSEGAIGIPQFLPSNIESYGRDGDGDGRIDLFNHADAIASVAFYLRQHRWRKARGTQEKKRVLLRYNHSTYYVDTVYTLAQRLDRAEASATP